MTAVAHVCLLGFEPLASTLRTCDVLRSSAEPYAPSRASISQQRSSRVAGPAWTHLPIVPFFAGPRRTAPSRYSMDAQAQAICAVVPSRTHICPTLSLSWRVFPSQRTCLGSPSCFCVLSAFSPLTARFSRCSCHASSRLLPSPRLQSPQDAVCAMLVPSARDWRLGWPLVRSHRSRRSPSSCRRRSVHRPPLTTSS